jgi:hypothetical protein
MRSIYQVMQLTMTAPACSGSGSECMARMQRRAEQFPLEV